MKDKYTELLKKIRSIYNTTDNAELKNTISERIPEIHEIDDQDILKEIIIYLDWLDGRKDYTARGEYSNQQMIKWLREKFISVVSTDTKNICDQQENNNVIKPKFEIGDVMRTLEEAKHNITDGLPSVVRIDDNEACYYCTNEMIPFKSQDEYEYPPMNRKNTNVPQEEQ